MSREAKVTAGVVSAAVVAGLIVMAVPVPHTFQDAVAGEEVTAKQLESSVEVDRDATGAEAARVATDSTDYSTWSDVDLRAARAKDPHPTVINHPSRFAGACLQNSMMTRDGTLDGAQTLVDMGPTEYAKGAVTRNAEGKLSTYTVAAGDAGLAIGERFCVDYITVFQYNDIYPFPEPGEVVALLPE